MMINLSRMKDHIQYIGKDKMKAWIQPGKPLNEVYSELEQQQRIIPGGGCGSVCIGGLTLGGGWGPSLRKLGLTCDALEEARLIDANGDLKVVNNKKNSDLFWAIRGGGGGNFGVVTKLLFKLTEIKKPLLVTSISFTRKLMPIALKVYIKLLPKLNNNITSFGRLTVVDNDDDSAFLIWAQSYGTEEELKREFKSLLSLNTSNELKTLSVSHSHAHQLFNGIIPASLKNNKTINFKQFLYQSGAGEAEEELKTCGETPHPHKVTSCFPKGKDYEKLFKIITHRFLKNTKLSDDVITYLSIHSMGGILKKVPHDKTAFAFRDKEFMLQFQAWWKNSNDSQGHEYIEWIEGFRKEISDHIEGAFINFPDKNLVKDLDKQRVELMKYYYKDHLLKLSKVKTIYDPENLFSFGMSIPLLLEKNRL